MDVMAMVNAGLKMAIGGELRDGDRNRRMQSRNPYTHEVIADFPNATREDVDDAVRSASSAAERWAQIGWAERAKMMREFSARLRPLADQMAYLDALDSGVTIRTLRLDAQRAPGTLELFAGLAAGIGGRGLEPEPDRVGFSIRVPYGVVGRIVSYNHPYHYAVSKTAAALATGNTVVLKPSEHTSLTALVVGAIAQDIFPPGVFNVVTGDGDVGAAIAGHPDISRLAFTGGPATGGKILAAAAPRIAHVTLELGGKNPLIIFPDVNIDEAAKAALQTTSFTHCHGQSCQSTSRIYVHEDIRDDFIEAFASRIDGLTLGDPTLPETDVGPLAYRDHFDHVRSYLTHADEIGARFLRGSVVEASDDWIVPPTLIDQIPDDDKLLRDEIFGPIASIVPWNNADDAILAANNTRFGLTASVWCSDGDRALDVALRLKAGTVWINGDGRRQTSASFGGHKQSGLGTEGGVDELLSFTQEQHLILRRKSG